MLVASVRRRAFKPCPMPLGTLTVQEQDTFKSDPQVIEQSVLGYDATELLIVPFRDGEPDG